MAEETEFLRRLKRDVDTAEVDIKEAEAEIDKADRAGVDVTELQEELESNIESVRRIKSTYFEGE